MMPPASRITYFLRFLVVIAFILCCSLSPAEAWEALPSRQAGDPGYVYHPSSDDWRDITMYQLITDRFYDGDPSNNQANPEGIYNPLTMDGIHGGDFAGIEQHLDYIRYLGFSSVWISPVFLNQHGAYHGYHIIDFNRIDPHWGSLEDLRSMIDAAHERGLYVIIDVVFNHMGRSLMSDDPGFPAFSSEPYQMKWESEDLRFPPPFDDIDMFHAHGSIDDWGDHTQNVIGELRGLDDLKTEDPRVRRLLIDSHIALIAATDCDGFRVDTAHHVELDFWQQAIPEIREAASAMGKTNFILFAEALRHRDDDVSILTREGEFPSTLYYPYYFTLKGVWGYREATGNLSGRWRHIGEYGPRTENRLVTFGDNHDRERLLNRDYLDGDTGRLAALLTHLYASPGIPCVYYGTEQLFDGAKGHGAREPMFNPTEPGVPDRFDPSTETARLIRRLNHLRRLYPALTAGGTDVLHEEGAAGGFAFLRDGGEDRRALVTLNNSPRPVTLDLAAGGRHDFSSFVWQDALSENQLIPTGVLVRADTATVWVPAHQHRPLPPSVTRMEPAHASAGNSPGVPVMLQFDQPVRNTAAIRASINGEPVSPRRMRWRNGNRVLNMVPERPFARNSRVAWSLELPVSGDRITSHFHVGRPAGNDSNPLFTFKPDGLLDPDAGVVSSNLQTTLYAARSAAPGLVYLAAPAAAAHEDRFIMIAFSNHPGSVAAPWNKAGSVPAYDILVSDEGESDYTSIRGTRDMHWSKSLRRGVLEAGIDVGETRTLFVRTAAYATEEKGALVPGSELPEGTNRYLQVNIDSLPVH